MGWIRDFTASSAFIRRLRSLSHGPVNDELVILSGICVHHTAYPAGVCCGGLLSHMLLLKKRTAIVKNSWLSRMFNTTVYTTAELKGGSGMGKNKRSSATALTVAAITACKDIQSLLMLLSPYSSNSSGASGVSRASGLPTTFDHVHASAALVVAARLSKLSRAPPAKSSNRPVVPFADNQQLPVSAGRYQKKGNGGQHDMLHDLALKPHAALSLKDKQMLYHTLFAAAAQMVQDMGPREVSNTIWSLATLLGEHKIWPAGNGTGNAAYLSRTTSTAMASSDTAHSASHNSNVMIDSKPQNIIMKNEALQILKAPSQQQMNGQELSNVMWGLPHLIAFTADEPVLPYELMMKLMNDAISMMRNHHHHHHQTSSWSSGSREAEAKASSSSWLQPTIADDDVGLNSQTAAAAVLGRYDHNSAFVVNSRKVILMNSSPQPFDPQEMSVMLHAVAKMVLQQDSRTATDEQSEMKSNNVLSPHHPSSTRLRRADYVEHSTCDEHYYSLASSQHVMTNITSLLSSMSSSCLAETRHVVVPNFVKTWMMSVLRDEKLHKEFSPQGVFMCLWALGTLRGATTSSACSRDVLLMDKEGEKLLQSVLNDALLPKVNDLLLSNKLDIQALTNITWTLSRLMTCKEQQYDALFSQAASSLLAAIRNGTAAAKQAQGAVGVANTSSAGSTGSTSSAGSASSTLLGRDRGVVGAACGDRSRGTATACQVDEEVAVKGTSGLLSGQHAPAVNRQASHHLSMAEAKSLIRGVQGLLQTSAKLKHFHPGLMDASLEVIEFTVFQSRMRVQQSQHHHNKSSVIRYSSWKLKHEPLFLDSGCTISNILWAYATLNYPDYCQHPDKLRWVVKLLAEQASESASDMSVQELSNTMWALARLQSSFIDGQEVVAAAAAAGTMYCRQEEGKILPIDRDEMTAAAAELSARQEHPSNSIGGNFSSSSLQSKVRYKVRFDAHPHQVAAFVKAMESKRNQGLHIRPEAYRQASAYLVLALKSRLLQHLDLYPNGIASSVLESCWDSWDDQSANDLRSHPASEVQRKIYDAVRQLPGFSSKTTLERLTCGAMLSIDVAVPLQDPAKHTTQKCYHHESGLDDLTASDMLLLKRDDPKMSKKQRLHLEWFDLYPSLVTSSYLVNKHGSQHHPHCSTAATTLPAGDISTNNCDEGIAEDVDVPSAGLGNNCVAKSDDCDEECLSVDAADVEDPQSISDDDFIAADTRAHRLRPASRQKESSYSSSRIPGDDDDADNEKKVVEHVVKQPAAGGGSLITWKEVSRWLRNEGYHQGLAIEVEGPTHYLHMQKQQQQGRQRLLPDGATVLRNLLLASCGWKVLQIPVVEWRQAVHAGESLKAKRSPETNYVDQRLRALISSNETKHD
ncbi:hypothetical protein CEUSTIGMA_g7700.t1 [Chlamydomonas eustigma]|uniref:RAP domain-containing protein n=1 Tax=Chlamydomonas eustigma TaxID=1157962 RepID=A0A250XBL0_9CHLO|nr:hypothetical protein CEUSTIGMA_g7700.t1 [Chlamydomonas eustigma]|eukprot:GAX80262.1 hypothetical protein CEUSTIGMA_g7700.t1 [Chlamydomonas eustigma]